MKKSKITIYDIVSVALMAAFVYCATRFLMVKIPTPTGYTMIKAGNGICLLAGLLLGGWRGALAAGIGTAFFDLTDPNFAPYAFETFYRYFLMAGLCGLVSHWGGANGTRMGRNTAASILGAYFYSALYISGKVFGSMVMGSAFVPALAANATSIASSLINATVGVVIAVALVKPLHNALEQTNMGRTLYHHA